MRTTLLLLFVFLASESYSQFSVQRDTTRYSDSSRVTTTWSRIFIGNKGFWKTVDISIDTTSSTQTVLFLFGAAADTNNPAKKNVIRLVKNGGYNGYPTMEDTLRMKTLGGSAPTTVISKPIPPYLSR